MTSATLITLDFEEPLDKFVDTGNSAALETVVDAIREDDNCCFLYRGSGPYDPKNAILLVGWTTDFSTPSLESLLPHLASLPSARHLHFPTTLDTITTSRSPIPCDIHTLSLPSFSSSFSPSASSYPSSDAADLRARIESLKLNPYISGDPTNKRNVVTHMPPQAGMQAFKGCHRAWSQAAYPTYEQEAAAQKGECDHADDEEYIVIVQWRDRHSGEAFKDPARATENLKPEIWQTHFLAELDSLADHGVSRTERSVDWEEVALPVRRQSQSQALLQLSRSHSLSHSQSSHSRSRSRSHSQSASQSTSTPVSQSPAPSAGALSRSQSLRQRARSSSFGRDRSAGEPARTESFDARVRSVSLGERHGSLGEVRDEEVGLAVEQRQSLNLCEMAKFQFEVESDDEYEEEEVVGEDTKVAGEVETAGRDRADSGLGLSNGKVIGLGGIREEEEDEAGELRERGDVDVGYCTPTPASSSQVASARAKLEEGPRKSESEARGPVPIRGSLIDDAREKFEAGLSRPKRYSSMLRKDEEEKQGVPKGPGLSRTKTLPAQARDSLKLELTKSRMERMSQVH